MEADELVYPELPPFRKNLARAIRRDYIEPADPSTLVFLRAYAVGYAIETLPALARLLLSTLLLARSGVKWRIALVRFRHRLVRILKRAFGKNGIALFFAVALGGAKYLERIVHPLLRGTRIYEERIARNDAEATSESKTEKEVRHERWTTFLSSTLAAAAAFSLQHRQRNGKAAAVASLPLVNLPGTGGDSALPMRSGLGKRYESATLNFTLFLLLRATDTALRAKCSNLKGQGNALPRLVAKHGDTLLFTLSSWTIMWHWIYKPWLLPPSYNRWIHSLAHIDPRLIHLLRHARRGDWAYGRTPSLPAAKTIGSGLCESMGWPAEAGMPDRVAAFPCQIVHGKLGDTPSCAVNVARRWKKAWLEGLGLYLPVHLLPLFLFSYKRLLQNPRLLLKSLFGAGRSAAFLASFVGLMWGGICAGRTVFGPSLYGTQQLWDGGLAMALGTFLCGWSVLIENKRRRIEMALFVAPRALYTIIDKVLPNKLAPRRSHQLARELERIVFALSAATIITFQVHQPAYIRGFVRSMAQCLVGSWGIAAS